MMNEISDDGEVRANGTELRSQDTGEDSYRPGSNRDRAHPKAVSERLSYVDNRHRLS